MAPPEVQSRRSLKYLFVTAARTVILNLNKVSD